MIGIYLWKKKFIHGRNLAFIVSILEPLTFVVLHNSITTQKANCHHKITNTQQNIYHRYASNILTA